MTSDRGKLLNELIKQYKIRGNSPSDKLFNLLCFINENPLKPSSEKPVESENISTGICDPSTHFQQAQKPETSETSECLSRFEHEGEYFCVNRKAHAQKLVTLKICSKCQWKLTKEKAEGTGLLLRTRYYTTCGAKQHHDKKKGLMLYCSKHFQGQWVTPQDCKTAKCLHLKEVKTT